MRDYRREFPDDTSDLVNKIEDLRFEMGLSLRDLANLCGVSSSSFSSWFPAEKGDPPKKTRTKTPNTETLKLIAQGLGVSVEYLVGDWENKSIDNALVGLWLGLSDGAISELEQMKKDSKIEELTFMNHLIENGALFDLVKTYLMSNVIKHIESSDWSLIPLKEHPPAQYQDVFFSAVLNELPKYSQDMDARLQKDKRLLNKLTFEYLERSVDEQNLERIKEHLIQTDAEDIDYSFEQMVEEELRKTNPIIPKLNPYVIQAGPPEHDGEGNWDKREEYAAAREICERRLVVVRQLLDYVEKKADA